jgi:hypothetical protein
VNSKIVELASNYHFITLARNDMPEEDAHNLKCHRGQVKPILNVTTTSQNATRDPDEVKCNEYYEILFSVLNFIQ